MKTLKKLLSSLSKPQKNLLNPEQKPETSQPNPETKNRKKKWQNNAGLILVAGFLIFLTLIFWFADYRQWKPIFNLAARSGQTAQIAENKFNNINLQAKAAYVFDIPENRPLFEKNADAQLALASITKIMTAVVAEENLPSYLLITIPLEAILQEGDEGFLAGEQWQINELIDAMLISSSNDAAFALAFEYDKNFPGNGDFVSLMNRKAEELGLMQTYFMNPTGLDLSENNAGAYGSAKDIAKLFVYAIKNHFSLIEATRLGEINLHSRKFKNTDQIINDLAGFIAGKTGFSDLAGGNLAVVADKGYAHPIIIVVLGSTSEGRFSDVKTLYQAAVSDNIN